MLKIITGPAGSGKTTAIYRRITAATEKSIFIVPDQYRFETEKRIYNETNGKKTLGADGDIWVTGFNDLAETILKQNGSNLRYADYTAKQIVMLKAVMAAREGFQFFAKGAYKSSFPAFALKIITGLKNDGITADKIRNAAEVTAGSLQKKLSDIALIYDSYDKLLKASYADRQDNLAAAADIAAQQDYFADYEVFLDGFDVFGGSQLLLLQPIVQQSVCCTVGFTGSVTENSESEYFLQQKKMLQKLSAFAENELGDTEITVLSGDTPDRYKSDNIRALRNGLPSGELPAALDDGSIRLCSAQTMEQETQYICAEIHKLVQQNGYRYKDIAVLTPSPAAYAGKISSAAKLYDIPLFADIPVPISEKPLLKYLLFLLAAAENPNGENMLRYIKSGFVRIHTENGRTRALQQKEINDFQEYCETWDLYSRSWGKPFSVGKDSGYTALEELRQKIALPLAELKKRCKNLDGRGITRELTRFLFDENDIQAAIQGKCMEAQGGVFSYNKQLKDEYNQLWSVVSDFLTSLYEALLGVEFSSLEEYARVLKSCADNITMSSAPKVMDSVIFGDTLRTRCGEVKAVFVMGACLDSFPPIPAQSEVFTSAEITELAGLSENSLTLSGDEAMEYSAGLMTVYNTLCKPSERLYICYSGDSDRAAECIPMLQQAFGLYILDVSTLPIEFYCRSIKSLQKQLAAVCVDKPELAELLKQVLKDSGDNEYPRLIDHAVSRLGENAQHKELSIAAAGLIFPLNTLSPSAVDKLCGCRFNYFIAYGLNISGGSSVRMNSNNIGNLSHFLLKEFFEVVYKNGKPEKDFIPDFDGIINTAAQKFRQLNLLEGEEMPPQYERLFAAITKSAIYMARMLFNEQQSSGFIPSYFELDLRGRDNNENEVKPDINAKPFLLEIASPGGDTRCIKMGGIADRVDIFTDNNGNKQIKVIDYKTYKKDYLFTKNYYGLDLQLPLYLFALCDTNPGFLPAAAVYYPLTKPSIRNMDMVAEKYRQGLWATNNKQTGISVAESVADIEKDIYKYCSLTLTGKDTVVDGYGAKRISAEQLSRLRKRAETVIRDNAELLLSGDVSAVPVCEGYKPLACEHCEYAGVCGFNGSHYHNISGEAAVGFSNSMTAISNDNTADNEVNI